MTEKCEKKMAGNGIDEDSDDKHDDLDDERLEKY
jgi:hypothetical protein